jgi:hypothetical protein
MTRRRAPVVVTALAAAILGGCRDEGVRALEATRERVCKCQDAACVNAAMDALEDRPTRHQRRAEGIAREITDCIARVYRESDARDVADELGAEPAPPPTDP